MQLENNISAESPISVLFSKKEHRTLKKFQEAELTSIKSLLNIWPSKVIQAPKLSPFKMATVGDLFRGRGKIVKIMKRPSFYNGRFKKKIPLFNVSVVVKDELSSDTLNLHWFNTYPSVYKKLETMTTIDFQGEVRDFNGTKQISNPLFDVSLEDTEILINYPTVSSISGAILKNIIDRIPRNVLEEITDPLPGTLREKHNFPKLSHCYYVIHAKNEFKNVEGRNLHLEQVERRFAYEYFLDQQLKLITRRSRTKIKSVPKILISNAKYEKIINSLNLNLTGDQKKTLQDIVADFGSGHPMMRLLQGDVGCGKTVVAFVAMAINAANKNQTAMMCPTETLALQHFNSIKDFADILKINCKLWLGGQKAKDKKQFIDELKLGKIDFVIGTHSLIQKDIEFKELNFVIIDEQHKFGVKQRLALSQKAESCHTLTMTATPIPRSLSLIQFGDLDVSVIKEMPKGRKGHKTRIVEPQNFVLFLNFLKTRLNLNEQAYVVVPAINESEGMDLLNLEKVLKKFKEIFCNHVVEGLHGKMKSEEKSDILDKFVQNKINILIATSVVEVGINNPNATIMAIMNPERFGLSSLHQLRGRVGRGNLPGFCFLICDKKLSSETMERLKVIERTSDGFEIAEEDLKIRGHGDLFGTEQSGDLKDIDFKLALKHLDLLEVAKKDAEVTFKKEHQGLYDPDADLTPVLPNKYQENPLVIQTT